jgi:NOL1/NOP2/fmu family ribosome biogenesis protein
LYLERRFGVPVRVFDDAAFAEVVGGEIWVATRDAARTGGARRPAGLRAFRRSPDGLKPTSAFLVSIGHLVTSARIDLDAQALRSLLLGRRLAADATDGYVALSHAGAVFGCGLIADGIVRCVIPTGRRQELLDILAASPPRRAPEM